MLRLAVAFIAVLAASLSVSRAAEVTTVLTVHHAWCVLCGPIVKSTLERVHGVVSAEVSQADGNADVTAVVTYDDALVTPDALVAVTTNQGYPAEVKS